MKIIIFGTGDSAKSFLNDIEESTNIIAFADNNQAMWGKSLNNIAIINPAEILEFDYEYIIICSMFTKEIILSLLARGIKRDKIIAYYNNFYTREDREKELFIINKITKQKVKGNKNIALVTRGNSGCNCRALYENIPDQIKQKFNVTLISLDEFKEKWRDYEVSITTNIEGRFYKNRINIETFHGFPIKTLGALEKRCTDNLENVNNGTDYFISYSSMYSFIMSSVFKVDINKFKITGMPRNDFFKENNSKKLLTLVISQEVKNKKIIFYVPTFRKRKDKLSREGINILNCGSDFEIINEYCSKNNILFIIKKHPREGDESSNINYKNILFLSDETFKKRDIDFYQLLAASDMLITDYSSVYFDYLLLNKPIIFWIKDQEEYTQDRGFLFANLDYMMPGPRAKKVTELIECINKFYQNNNWFKIERENIKNLTHTFQDFNSSKRVWDMFLKLY